MGLVISRGTWFVVGGGCVVVGQQARIFTRGAGRGGMGRAAEQIDPCVALLTVVSAAQRGATMICLRAWGGEGHLTVPLLAGGNFFCFLDFFFFIIRFGFYMFFFFSRVGCLSRFPTCTYTQADLVCPKGACSIVCPPASHVRFY